MAPGATAAVKKLEAELATTTAAAKAAAKEAATAAAKLQAEVEKLTGEKRALQHRRSEAEAKLSKAKKELRDIKADTPGSARRVLKAESTSKTAREASRHDKNAAAHFQRYGKGSAFVRPKEKTNPGAIQLGMYNALRSVANFVMLPGNIDFYLFLMCLLMSADALPFLAQLLTSTVESHVTAAAALRSAMAPGMGAEIKAVWGPFMGLMLKERLGISWAKYEVLVNRSPQRRRVERGPHDVGSLRPPTHAPTAQPLRRQRAQDPHDRNVQTHRV